MDTVGTLGFSMGGAVALLQAAGERDRPDAVAAVSAASRWWDRGSVAMRRLHWLAERPHGRLALRTVGVRLARPLHRGVQASPIEVVGHIQPTPLLIVHGDEDHYVSVDHAIALHRATGGTAELWVRPGMRHAETAMTPELVDELGTWLLRRGRGRWTGQSSGSERA